MVTSGLPSEPFPLVRISAHHEPSLNHSLLCGLSSVGEGPAAANAGPWYVVVAAPAEGATTTCSDTRPRSSATSATAIRRDAAPAGRCGEKAWLMSLPPCVVQVGPHCHAASRP